MNHKVTDSQWAEVTDKSRVMDRLLTPERYAYHNIYQVTTVEARVRRGFRATEPRCFCKSQSWEPIALNKTHTSIFVGTNKRPSRKVLQIMFSICLKIIRLIGSNASVPISYLPLVVVNDLDLSYQIESACRDHVCVISFLTSSSSYDLLQPRPLIFVNLDPLFNHPIINTLTTSLVLGMSLPLASR